MHPETPVPPHVCLGRAGVSRGTNTQQPAFVWLNPGQDLPSTRSLPFQFFPLFETQFRPSERQCPASAKRLACIVVGSRADSLVSATSIITESALLAVRACVIPVRVFLRVSISLQKLINVADTLEVAFQ